MARGRRRGRKKRSRSRSRSRSSNRCKSGERKNYMGKCVKKGKRKNKSCGTGYKKDWMSGDCVKKKNTYISWMRLTDFSTLPLIC